MVGYYVKLNYISHDTFPHMDAVFLAAITFLLVLSAIVIPSPTFGTGSNKLSGVTPRGCQCTRILSDYAKTTAVIPKEEYLRRQL